jgi:putative phosphoribosyl transferase
MASPFRDRTEAGRRLAEKLARYAGQPDTIVLALPRGGVPVAYDVYLVRKLGVPGHEELALGAIATGGVRVLVPEVIREAEVPEHAVERVTQQELRELERRERAFRGERPPPDVRGRTVILVDDGLATGATMRAAIAALKQQGPARIVVAVPTAAPQTCESMRREVDDVVCAITPEPFYAVGLWYDDFAQTTDDEVKALLERASWRQPASQR